MNGAGRTPFIHQSAVSSINKAFYVRAHIEYTAANLSSDDKQLI